MTEVQKTNMYELVATYKTLDHMIMEAGGEISPEIEEQLKAVELAIPRKVDGYAYAIDRLDAGAEYWSKKAAEYKKIAESHKKISAKLESIIKESMIAMGKDELLGEDVKYKLAKGQTEKLILDEEKVDAAFKMIVTTQIVDKARIKEALIAGFEVAGASLEIGRKLLKQANKKDV